jgi:septum formation protein
LEILRNHGIEPEVIVPEVDESIPVQVSLEQAGRLVERLALEKARSLLPNIAKLFNDYKILAADTIVYKDRILGKPRDVEEATAMLQMLRNTGHEVLTGVALIAISTGDETAFHDRTTVYFKQYSDEQIAEYLRTEPPFDKAGSYGIQGIWGSQVERICGDRENVMGLPWHRIEELL